MKAITIIEPWATLLVVGEKQYETRDWKCDYRGLMAIHSGMKIISEYYYSLGVIECMENSEVTQGILKRHRGNVIAIATLKDIHSMTDEFINEQTETEQDLGLWKIGRYAWEFTDIKPLPKPIPVRGMPGLWNISDELINF